MRVGHSRFSSSSVYVSIGRPPLTHQLSPAQLKMQQQPTQPHLGGFSAANVTTEIIQKCLDENKQLILAILDNQNLGKLNECAIYQAKLQSNLMYLAAIADSQPQPQPVHPQVPPTAVLQPGPHYMHHQQAQQQMAQQSLMLARNQMQYTQQQVASLHQVQQQQQHHHQQHHMQGQHGISSGGNSSLQMVSTEMAMTGNSSLPSGGFSDFGRSGNADGLQVSRSLGGEMRVGKPDVGAVSDVGHIASGDVNGASGAGQTVDDPETPYLKASEEDGS